ncbi:50S ribosomal protein L32e [archaeon]|mgnify:CR=1 FL=1|jgi:ribosomal protein L32E|nr:50S ribosomal protein L32e [archaeon]
MKFLRRDAKRFFKFGKGKGKKASWRKPTGRDNKMREKRRGYAPSVSIGYRSDKEERGKIVEQKPILIMNLKDLEKLNKESIGIVGNVGKKKKIEIAKKAQTMKIRLKNLNVEKFLKGIDTLNKLKDKKSEETKGETPLGVPQKSKLGGNKQNEPKK